MKIDLLDALLAQWAEGNGYLNHKDVEAKIEKAESKGFDDCLNLILQADDNALSKRLKSKIEEAKKQERGRVFQEIDNLVDNYLYKDGSFIAFLDGITALKGDKK